MRVLQMLLAINLRKFWNIKKKKHV